MPKNMGIKNPPRIGLVSNGSEPTKGNELTLKAHQLLANAEQINFMGNVEGRDFGRTS